MATPSSSKYPRALPLLKAMQRLGYRADIVADPISVSEAKLTTRRYARALPLIRSLRAIGYDVAEFDRGPLFTI